MAKTGRPRKKINWTRVAKLCARQWTQEEIASEFDICVDTLDNACQRDNGKSFSEFFATKKLKGLGSLRSRQYAIAESGNPTMLIWLGKNWLGQSDRQESNRSKDRLEELMKAKQQAQDK